MTQGGAFYIRRPDARGFTLLELIVVLIIIGAASALVVPRLMGGMSSLDVRSAAGKVAATLRYAGSQAISGKIEHRALFDFEHNRLILESADDQAAKADGDAVEEESTGSSKRVYDLPEKIFFKKVDKEDFNLYDETLDAEIFGMTFYPGGGSDGGEICLANERGRLYIVKVDRITGSVKVIRGEKQ